MGRLKYPFIAGAAALLILGVLLSPRLFPRWEDFSQAMGGAFVGVLAGVVLYAVMRAVAARG